MHLKRTWESEKKKKAQEVGFIITLENVKEMDELWHVWVIKCILKVYQLSNDQ